MTDTTSKPLARPRPAASKPTPPRAEVRSSRPSAHGLAWDDDYAWIRDVTPRAHASTVEDQPEGIPRIETSAFSLRSFDGPRIPTLAADRPHRIFTGAEVPLLRGDRGSWKFCPGDAQEQAIGGRNPGASASNATTGLEDLHFYTMNRADLVFAICHLIGLRGWRPRQHDARGGPARPSVHHLQPMQTPETVACNEAGWTGWSSKGSARRFPGGRSRRGF